MRSRKQTLVLFEDVQLREETIRYAAAFAQRTNTGLFLLMILAGCEQGEATRASLKDHAEKRLAMEAEKIRRAGVPVEHEILMGDPPSEFYKFLAIHPTFDSVIWGGRESAPRPGSSSHWLESIHSELQAQFFVTPTKRPEWEKDKSK